MTSSATPSCPYCNHEFAAEGDDIRDCPECGRTVLPALDVHTGRLEAWTPVELGDFRIETSIGRGGMGRLFKGENRATGECVAIKFPLAGRESDESTLSRFEREIGILKSLDHPNVVQFLASGEEAGLRYYVMEWIDGDDLGKVISDCRRKGGSLPFELVHNYFKQVCRGLQAIHTKGIIHRDVKPTNIMLTVDGTVKLLDLGVAKFHEAQTTVATQTMGVAGTNQYAAPEQLTDPQNVDHRADIFSLGLVAYEMLTGIVPRGTVRKPSGINGTVPAWFDTIVLGMMEHDRDGRPNRVLKLARVPLARAPKERLVLWGVGIVFSILCILTGILLAGVLGMNRAIGGAIGGAVGAGLAGVAVRLALRWVTLPSPSHPSRSKRLANWIHWAVENHVAGIFLIMAIGIIISIVIVPFQERPTDDSMPVRFVSRDGQYLIEAPSGWQDSSQSLREGALISASDFGRNLHIVVSAVSKNDLAERDLRAYAATEVIQFSQSCENSETMPRNVTLIDGHGAFQWEAHGAFNDAQLSFFLTCIDTGDRFCTIAACTERSRFEENRVELTTITRTFRHVENGNE